MQEVLRGQIYYVDGNGTPVGAEIWSDRPALIVSNNVSNKHSGAVEVVYLTTTPKKHYSPVHVSIKSHEKDSIALCEQVHSVDKSRLRDYMGQITPQEQENINKALIMSLACSTNNCIGLFKKWEYYVNKYHIKFDNEDDNIQSQNYNKAVDILQKQIEMLRRERDSYRTLYETNQARLDSIYDKK